MKKQDLSRGCTEDGNIEGKRIGCKGKQGCTKLEMGAHGNNNNMQDNKMKEHRGVFHLSGSRRW
jgi:hypothetical protein